MECHNSEKYSEELVLSIDKLFIKVLPVFFPILPQSHSCIFFKHFSQMTLRGKSQISGDFNIRIG